MKVISFKNKNGAITVKTFHEEDENSNGVVNTTTQNVKKTHTPHTDLTKLFAKLKKFVPLEKVEVIGGSFSGKDASKGIQISFETSDFIADAKKAFYTEHPDLEKICDKLKEELVEFANGKTGEVNLFTEKKD